MLKGKTAIVTGGTSGIGKAIATAFAKNGADVAIPYVGSNESALETENALCALGVKAKCYPCDVSSNEQAEATVKQIVADFGSVDILVNNAGITRDKLMLMMKESDFDDVIGVNLKGAFLMTKQVYPIMMKKRYGKIINMSSVAGIMGNAGQTNYSASKAGLIGLTKSVAKELAPRGVCCNAIAPGFVATDMTAAFQKDEQVLSGIPMHRFAKPEEVAALALFLASPSSDYITGEVIGIDGGICM